MPFDFKLRAAAREILNSGTVGNDPKTALRLIGWLVDEFGHRLSDEAKEKLEASIIVAYDSAA